MKNKGQFQKLALFIIGLLILATLLTLTQRNTIVTKAATPTVTTTHTVRILALGDSITGLPDPGCWRALLWNKLQSTGHTNIDFVGTLNSTSKCGGAPPYDGQNEGFSGISAATIANQNDLPGWLSVTNPDIVMMHLGTNDVWGKDAPPSTILKYYSTLVSQMRAKNPTMRILVAQIIPLRKNMCADCAQGVINLDKAIPAWAKSISTAKSPVIVVDQWTGFDANVDTIDGAHPNLKGDQKMASKWYPPLAAQIDAFNASHKAGESSYYELVNRNSGLVLDMAGGSTANGAVAVQWSYGGGTNQQWQEVKVNGGYKLVNRNSGKLFEYPRYNKTAGTQLHQWSDTNSSNQWWKIVPIGNGFYNLVNQFNGLYVSVSGKATTNRAPVILWPANGGADQQWQLVAL